MMEFLYVYTFGFFNNCPYIVTGGRTVYIHCFAHILNLVLVDCSKKVEHAARFFALLESLYIFVSSAKAHVVFVCDLAKA